ncbi:streptophobe family protein [Kitasatospora cathayae]|uniref:Streptophobe family protein n=1 Tax=Kitasatospora cathayae TaxID=3004092 RepID=A0ABY7QDR2_9ACTN|nr:streptophobe family protein [Kitasatospora sp. HUAS 3-15]WBP90863.1 streptophobe family protein [Kitasatospora sp. HUAS 3-15]
MQQPTTGAAGPPGAVRGWLDALAVVLAGLVAMAAVAALGLWLAGADDLPEGGFPPVLAATLALAVGGSVQLDGGAGNFAAVDAGVDAMPLSVSLVGAVVMAEVFLRQLRFRAVAGGGELLGRIARTVVLWLIALVVITVTAKHTFVIQLGGSLVQTIGGALGLTPEVGFHADGPTTIGIGLAWLLLVLAAAFAVSRRAPLPRGLLAYQLAVRPAAFALWLVLLAYVVIGAVAGIIIAITHDDPRRTMAVLLLALPDLVWLAFGIGLGAAWHGRLVGGLGLPVPEPLSAVLRAPGGKEATIDLGSLADHDPRSWWLLPVAAVLLLAAAFLAAHRSPRSVRLGQHAVRFALATAVTVLLVGLWTRMDADYGLSVLGVGLGQGGLGDLLGAVLGGSNPLATLGSGSLTLRPALWPAVPLAVGWGLVTGLIGALLASRVRRRGEVTQDAGG